MKYAAKRQAITEFIQTLQKQEGLLIGFDEGLWNAAVEKAVVDMSQGVTFVFRDGSKVHGELISAG